METIISVTEFPVLPEKVADIWTAIETAGQLYRNAEKGPLPGQGGDIAARNMAPELQSDEEESAVAADATEKTYNDWSNDYELVRGKAVDAMSSLIGKIDGCADEHASPSDRNLQWNQLLSSAVSFMDRVCVNFRISLARQVGGTAVVCLYFAGICTQNQNIVQSLEAEFRQRRAELSVGMDLSRVLAGIRYNVAAVTIYDILPFYTQALFAVYSPDAAAAFTAKIARRKAKGRPQPDFFEAIDVYCNKLDIDVLFAAFTANINPDALVGAGQQDQQTIFLRDIENCWRKVVVATLRDWHLARLEPHVAVVASIEAVRQMFGVESCLPLLGGTVLEWMEPGTKLHTEFLGIVQRYRAMLEIVQP